MTLTPEEVRRQKHQEKMAIRKKKVRLIKLSIVGGTGLAVFLIIAFMPRPKLDHTAAAIYDTESSMALTSSADSSLEGNNESAQTADTRTESSPLETESATQEEAEIETEITETETERFRSESELAVIAQSSPYAEPLMTLAEEYPEIWTILDHMDEYPDELQKIVTENIETLDFVLSYPDKKENPPADTIGQVTKGTIPLLLQWDERWGYQPYGDNIIGTSGCGPTCIAMVAAGLTGRNDITPAKVASYSMEGGFLTEESDTRWELMSYGCEEFGITGTVISLEESVMAESLNAGSPIICSMRPGDFTNGGHFIVLTGYQDGNFQIHDPNSKERSEKLWSFETLQEQIKQLWSYSLCEK